MTAAGLLQGHVCEMPPPPSYTGQPYPKCVGVPRAAAEKPLSQL